MFEYYEFEKILFSNDIFFYNQLFENWLFIEIENNYVQPENEILIGNIF